MIRGMAGREALGPFHVNPGHEFEGFQMEACGSVPTLVVRCGCGELLDVANAVFVPCPECDRSRSCPRCGGTGRVVDHAALRWRLPDETEEPDADDT
jgi:hypothetical protein